MKKRMLSALIAAVMVLAMSATAFAGSFSANDALKKALKNAGLSKSKAKHIEKEYDREDNVYEIEFVKKSNKAEFEYEIAADTGKINKDPLTTNSSATHQKRRSARQRQERSLQRGQALSCPL